MTRESKRAGNRINGAQLLLELVIVVVGILLALGIDSLWAARQDRALERALLLQLEADMLRAEDQLREQLRLTEESAAAALSLTAFSRGLETAPNDSIAAWLTRVSWWSDPYPTMASAQSLVSSNTLQLIQSDSLRSSIVTFLDEVRQLESRIPRYEDTLFQRMESMSRLVDPLDRGQSIYVGVLEGGVEAHVESAIGGTYGADLQRLQTMPEFRHLTHTLFWVQENLRWLQQRILDATVSLRGEIEVALARG